MKFGKTILAGAIPEWQNYYLNYKGLKKLIKVHVASALEPSEIITVNAGMNSFTPNSKYEIGDDDALLLEDDNIILDRSDNFKTFLDREMEKIQRFYSKKEAELKSRLFMLQSKQSRSKSFDINELKSLVEAFRKLQEDIVKLGDYVEMNLTGRRKIIKKWEKQTRLHSMKELSLQSKTEEPNGNDATLLMDVQPLKDMRVKVNEALVELESNIYKSDNQECSVVSLALQAARNDDLSGLCAVIETHSMDPTAVLFELCLQDFLPPKLADYLTATFSIDYNYVDELTGETFAHLLASGKGQGLMEQLVASGGACLTAADSGGKTPLHRAVINGNDCFAKRLITDCPESALCADSDGLCALQYAVMHDRRDLMANCILPVDSIRSRLSTLPSLLGICCERGLLEMADILISSAGVTDISTANKDGLYPFHILCIRGDHQMTRLLMDKLRCDVEMERRDVYKGWKPIFYAAINGSTECVKLLIERGCLIESTDDAGWTPWAHAIWNGKIETAEHLHVPAFSQPQSPARSFSSSAIPLLNLDDPNSTAIGDGCIPLLDLPPPAINASARAVGRLELRVVAIEMFSLPPELLRIIVTETKAEDALIIEPQTAIYRPSNEEPCCFEFPLPAVKGSDDRMILQIHIYPIIMAGLPLGCAVINDSLLDKLFSSDSHVDQFGFCQIRLPVINTHFEVVGEVSICCSAILPTTSVGANIINDDSQADSVEVFGDCKVYFTKDLVPAITCNSPDVVIGDKQLTISQLYAHQLDGRVQLLKDCFKTDPIAVGVYGCLGGTMAYWNEAVDNLLSICYQQHSCRMVLYSNVPYVCRLLSWKQSNIPVYLYTNGRDLSLKKSAKFAKLSALSGIICPSKFVMNDGKRIGVLLREINRSGLDCLHFQDPIDGQQVVFTR